MQALFLALLQIQAVLVGATFALVIAYGQIIASRFSPSAADLVFSAKRILMVLGLLAVLLVLVGVGAILTSVVTPAPSLPDWASWILRAQDRHVQKTIVASVAVAAVITSAAAAVFLIIPSLRSYADPVQLSRHMLERMKPSSRRRRVHRAFIGEPRQVSEYQPLLELVEALVRGSDRLAHEACVEIVLEKTAAENEATLVRDFLAPAADLEEARGSPLFVADLLVKAVDRCSTPVVRDFVYERTARLLQEGHDQIAARPVEAILAAAKSGITGGGDPADRSNAINLVGNLGQVIAGAGRPVAAVPPIEALAPHRAARSPSVAAWSNAVVEIFGRASHEEVLAELFVVVDVVVRSLLGTDGPPRERPSVHDDVAALLNAVSRSVERVPAAAKGQQQAALLATLCDLIPAHPSLAPPVANLGLNVALSGTKLRPPSDVAWDAGVRALRCCPAEVTAAVVAKSGPAMSTAIGKRLRVDVTAKP